MASPMVVKRSLQAFANNYNKADRWVDDTLKLWARGLAAISDKDLVRGTEAWCKTKRTPPNLARLLELIDADPTTTKHVQLAGCPACDSTGWREMARHYYDKQERLRVTTCVAACDCSRGARYAMGAAPAWQDVVTSWESKPWTEAVHYSTPTHPHLTTAQRYTPDQIQAMSDRAKQAKHTTPSGWTKPIARP